MNRRAAYLLRRPHPQNRRVSLYGVVLLYQLFEHIAALESKPPITITLIILNLSIFAIPHLRPYLPAALAPRAQTLYEFFRSARVCLHPGAVLRGERWRLILSSFVHSNDLHVLYNMTSFLYKGVTLESALGSEYFLALIVYLSITAHTLYVLIALGARHLGITSSLMNRCVVGFSGVIFGLKVVINSDQRYADRAVRIFGISIPGGGAPWAELFLASALMPNVSFLGHLTGILAGLIYVYVPRGVSRFVATTGRGRRMWRHPRAD